ncbi:uncharacterized protein LOC114882299 [Osmia bicornis bicornis]|uniref:uncharacterized protein LOC114882299 n=1 Tax=Osmia bicornis bicornis TaxID=1437191 RepID=UPI001EAE9029|nr:uncharacterized protein LOC114882299 [Osmia bicornis bicornis]
MANITSIMSMEQCHDICPEDIANSCTNVTVSNTEINSNGSKSLEDLQCFVCDAKIQGRHYALATCRTQTSRTKVIEKLGELVGERYMVVISEDDVICRSCANLINTLDRLEVEIYNVRDNVLRFLEQKYSLEEGELLGNNEKQKRSQPPQITKCNNQIITNCQGKKRDVILSSNIAEKTKHKKSNVWLQCDKCQYTTLHNSFMVHHVRNHIKQKVFCDKCGVQFSEKEHKSHNCSLKEHLNVKNTVQNEPQAESSLKHITETILDIPILEKNMQQNVPIMAIETYTGSQISNCNENIPIIRLSSAENLPIQNILTSDDSSGQPIYVRVLQPVEINETSTHSTIMASNSDADLTMKFKDNSDKQILTLTEDGNLEMTEIACWNDIQSSQSNIIFQ